MNATVIMIQPFNRLSGMGTGSHNQVVSPLGPGTNYSPGGPPSSAVWGTPPPGCTLRSAVGTAIQ